MTTTDYSARNSEIPPEKRWHPEYREVPLDWITTSEINPRKNFDDESLQDLAESIREHGVLQPIVLRVNPADTHYAPSNYIVVAGERRYRAAKLAGLTSIPAVINRGIDEAAHLRLALVENLQRKDLDPLEEAAGYRELNRTCGLTQTQIAGAVNRSQPVIANRMRLLDLPEGVQGRIRSGELSPAHGIALCQYKEFPKVAEKIAALAVEGNWTSKKIESGTHDMSDLSKAHLVHVFNWEDMFDCCKTACPHEAFRPGYGYGVCLNPGCYREKNKERKAEAAKQVEEQKAAGKVFLRGMKGGTYVEFRGWGEKQPQTCRPDCENLRSAQTSYGSDTTVCLDPACYARLKAADEAAVAKERTEIGAQIRKTAAQAVESLDDITSREIVLMAHDRLDGSLLRSAASIVEAHAPALAGMDLAAMTGMQRLEILAAVPPLQLVRLFVGITAALEAQSTEKGWRGSYPTVWYLGLEETKD